MRTVLSGRILMDKNKFQELRRVKYRLRPCCGNCEQGQIAKPTDWGLCAIHSYKHGKHTTLIRDLSVNRYGLCGEHRYSQRFLMSVSHFKEFLKTEA